jgi:alpha-glucoside transport system permease protein
VQRTFRPALVAVAVLEFVLVWNDFIVGFLISGPGSTPLSLVLWGEARQFSTASGPVAAAATVASVVPVVLLLTFWRTVVRGLTTGSRP